jgi:hypothetical protein
LSKHFKKNNEWRKHKAGGGWAAVGLDSPCARRSQDRKEAKQKGAQRKMIYAVEDQFCFVFFKNTK